MADLWEHSDRIACTHPGWATLTGWASVASSFFALFQGPGHIQFILTREEIRVEGDVAWVTVDENILGDQGGAAVASLNLFCRHPGHGRWMVVAHHGSAMAPSARAT